MVRLLKSFFRAEAANPYLVVGSLVLASMVEGLGFATLLPLVALATDQGTGKTSALSRYVEGTLHSVGLPATVGTLLIVVISVLVLRSLLTLFAMRYVGYATADVTTSIRQRLIDSLIAVRWSFMVQQPLGRIANLASLEANRAGQSYRLVAQLVTSAAQAVVAAIVALAVNWEVALAAFVVGGLMAAGLNFLVRIARRAGFRQTQRSRELLIFLSDTLANIKPVKAMAKEKAFASLFDDRLASLRRALRRQVISRETLNNVQDIIFAILLGIGFWLAHSVWSMPIAELLVVGIVLYRTVSSLGNVQKAYQQAVMFESAHAATEEMIAEARADPEPNPGTRKARFEHAVELKDVHFSHGGHEVLKGVSLSVKAGELLVLTGPSGAGKTTIVDLILGLYRPRSGEVLIDGVSLTEIDLKSWRGLVGYVPQELVLFHDTVRANLTLGDEAVNDEDLEMALEAAGALGFVNDLPQRLETVVGEKGSKLSGGQRQRIALARALALKPRLLILDEVTSALDPKTAAAITQNIRSFGRNVTILSITHRSEFLDMADRVFHVENGVAVEDRRAAAASLLGPAVA